MSEEKLKRIEQIKQNWADEVRKIDSDKEVKGLNQEKYNKPYRELEKKYLPLLREAINTNVWLQGKSEKAPKAVPAANEAPSRDNCNHRNGYISANTL